MMQSLFAIYYNFVTDRPKFGLYGLLVLALLTSLNTGFGMIQYGFPTAFVSFLFAFFLWATILPCAIYIIDAHKGNIRRKSK